MASTKRLLKERANLARNPIPYVTFNDDDDDDGGGDSMAVDTGINQWKFILALDPAHDSLDEPSDIGKAADSAYCRPPPPEKGGGKKSGSGLIAGVTRAAKSSTKRKEPSSPACPIPSKSDGGPAYFAFRLDFPPNYPFKPPTITVLGPTYHPNVSNETGAMCDAVLTGKDWAPTLNVRKICARLRKFLCEPDPDHPLESAIAQMLVDHPGEYASKAFKHAAEFHTRGKAEDVMKNGGGGKQKK